MATEPGVVTRIGSKSPQTAWVKIVPSNACEACSSRHSCTAKPGGDDREVEALNPVGATVGDKIQLMIKTSSLLKATFLLYIFPILCMLAGGIAGHLIAIHLQWDASLLAAIVAFICLGAAMLVVRLGGNRMAQKAAYRPRIIRIIGRHTGFPNKPNCDNPAIPVV
jgi:sigma-E factor negative regulatory protein RseC